MSLEGVQSVEFLMTEVTRMISFHCFVMNSLHVFLHDFVYLESHRAKLTAEVSFFRMGQLMSIKFALFHILSRALIAFEFSLFL